MDKEKLFSYLDCFSFSWIDEITMTILDYEFADIEMSPSYSDLLKAQGEACEYCNDRNLSFVE